MTASNNFDYSFLAQFPTIFQCFYESESEKFRFLAFSFPGIQVFHYLQQKALYELYKFLLKISAKRHIPLFFFVKKATKCTRHSR